MSFLTAPLTSILIQPKRSIGGLSVNVVLNENTKDELTITKQPIQQGAAITDHSFLEPVIFSTTVYQEANLNESLNFIYLKFQDLQQGRVPFDIITPKRIYKNMLLASLGMTTDKYTENILALNMTFQQVIIVSVGNVIVPKARQRAPRTTQATQAAGRKQSAASGLSDAGVAFFRAIP